MIQTENNYADLTDFHAVEFMRQVRAKHAEEFQADRQRYIDNARKALEKFKANLKKPDANVSLG